MNVPEVYLKDLLPMLLKTLTTIFMFSLLCICFENNIVQMTSVLCRYQFRSGGVVERCPGLDKQARLEKKS